MAEAEADDPAVVESLFRLSVTLGLLKPQRHSPSRLSTMDYNSWVC